MTLSKINYARITPNHFFTKPDEKTKFNWFAFELACEIHTAVSPQLKKQLANKGYTQETFNQACIKLSKRLQNVILKKLRNEIPEMEISHLDVEIAFPKLNDASIQKLLDATGKAWGNLLDVCVCCPSACISNRNNYAEMFDDPSYYDA